MLNRIAQVSILVAALACQGAWAAAGSQDGDPTPRKALDPIDAAKVKQFEAKRWIEFGAGAARERGNQVQTGIGGSIPGRRSCNTQIGPTTSGNVGPGGQPVATPRFGARQDTPVIVTGSVINVCK